VLGDAFQLVVAFSREDEKAYVQDKIRDHAAAVHELLQQGAAMYVCGAATMAKDVQATLVSLVAVQKGWEQSAAEQFFKDMRAEGRYQVSVRNRIHGLPRTVANIEHTGGYLVIPNRPLKDQAFEDGSNLP
jgi:hypothetical protein